MDKDEGNCCSLAGFVCGAGVELGERHQNYQINEQCNSSDPYFGQPRTLSDLLYYSHIEVRRPIRSATNTMFKIIPKKPARP